MDHATGYCKAWPCSPWARSRSGMYQISKLCPFAAPLMGWDTVSGDRETPRGYSKGCKEPGSPTLWSHQGHPGLFIPALSYGRETSFLFFFFSFIFISWRLITLQHCSGFCHTLKWISHGFETSFPVEALSVDKLTSWWIHPGHQGEATLCLLYFVNKSRKYSEHFRNNSITSFEA